MYFQFLTIEDILGLVLLMAAGGFFTAILCQAQAKDRFPWPVPAATLALVAILIMLVSEATGLSVSLRTSVLAMGFALAVERLITRGYETFLDLGILFLTFMGAIFSYSIDVGDGPPWNT